MPTYEYACRSCGKHQEVVQSFKDDPLTTCPACGGELRKVYGNVGIVFKGNGFYKTDSRTTTKGGHSGSGGAGDAQKAPAETPSSSSETSKPAEPATSATKDAGSSSAGSGASSNGSGSGASSTSPARSVPAAS
ncbi:MAG TPA: FmdB family zinc ribbon protein [Acidimicrobiales bacterium]|nr:FmdB family zinc ribbon protein [Acidimicrobiales bacterium]